MELKRAGVEQTQKMIPFITFENSFGQNVCELVFGVNVFGFGSWCPIKQPIKSNSVGSGNMSGSFEGAWSITFSRSPPRGWSPNAPLPLRTDNDWWHLFSVSRTLSQRHTCQIVSCHTGKNRYYLTWCTSALTTDWEQQTADTQEEMSKENNELCGLSKHKHIQQSFLMRRLDVWGNTINVIQHVGRS